MSLGSLCRSSAVLVTLCLLIRCASHNLVLGSRCHSRAEFKKREMIMVALPDEPTDEEKAFIGRLKSSLVSHGFKLTDDLSSADRILTFHLRPSVEFRTYTHIQNSFGWTRDVIEEKYDTYTFLELNMFDVKMYRSGVQTVIWRATLGTLPEHFTDHPDDILDQALELYGKNQTKMLRFKPAYKRKDR